MHCMVHGQAPQLAQMRKGAIEYCVLALLRHDERYGFELIRDLSTADLVTSEGTIYPLLSRLRKDGLVETTWRESTQGPPRRYYRLTAQGKASLESFISQWQQFSEAVNRILVSGGKT
jgi:PadR family transcriptional regulator, regulatory protein PadR